MFDFFYILTNGGLVLWCMPSAATKFFEIINNAIDHAILQGHGTAQKWISNLSSHYIHYKVDNEYPIIFIVGYQQTFNISYADKFLDEIQKRFRDEYKNDLTSGNFNRSFPFRLSYNDILSKMDETKVQKRGPRSYYESKKYQERGGKVTKETVPPPKPNPSNDSTNSEAIIRKPNQINLVRREYVPFSYRLSSSDSFWSKLKTMSGFTWNRLTPESLQTSIEAMREHLIAKNVAANVSEKICQSVSMKLAGKTFDTFESLTTDIRQAIRDTLMMILTPKQPVDILRGIMDAQNAQRPYVIIFCGVNGVGKSTNLAKVAYWLRERDLRILIAGCDTFRSGAIEQLRTHVCSLNDMFNEQSMIELFERGYGKDPAGIAKQAIHFAKVKKFDVVLIDTAGRMENDTPLMKALANLIHHNNPDMILFVGEALVGNRAVDQITQFNQALIDNTPLDSRPRTIDGILLTKFDTVGDKVGAAISMTYTTDKPIVFVGTGQQRQDLNTINADILTDILLQ